jgi:hypothetical protein
MSMSKKDFELIADVLSQGMAQDGSDEDMYERTAQVLIYGMAAALAANYPNFKKDVFLRACGVVR